MVKYVRKYANGKISSIYTKRITEGIIVLGLTKSK
jgi:hypothetical protein